MKAADSAGITVQGGRVGSMMTLFFSREEVRDYASAKMADTSQYAAFFRGMLESGFYFAPSQFEAAFVSTTHTQADLDRTVAAAAEVLRALAT